MKQNKFSKTKLATSLSLILSATSVSSLTYAYADEEKAGEVEVIQVTGMRSTIKESTRLKRDASGVVDAISAEDIGKFPDTNLAESLQRITGVSIDRSNGEGSKITVRGFGPDFNMVTLNGRAMPAASLPGGGGVPNSRAFDFANLASESVRSVEVYKTGRANIASGGIGASIDIKTAKPFDATEKGLITSVGVKALHDTTVRVGDDVTPEVSGFLNFVNDDENFGVTVSASIQERHSSSAQAFVNQWRVNAFDGSYPQSPNQLDPNLPDFNGPALNVTNAPVDGELFAIPSDLRYAISDHERERTNAQVTLQYAPTDQLIATLDYTYSKQDIFQARAEQSIWMDDRYFSDITFDNDNPDVKSPILLTQERRDLEPRDLGLAIQEQNQINENKSIGLNLAYEVNDRFSLALDIHDSSAEGRPDAPYGVWTNLGLGANIAAGQGADFSGEFPIMTVDFDDESRGNLNPNGSLDAGDIGTSILDMNFARQQTDITQVRLDGTYEFDEGSIDFGIESRSMENVSQQALTRQTLGNWGIENPGELPDDFLTPVDFKGLFDDFNSSTIFNQGITGSVAEIGPFATDIYGVDFTASDPLSTDRTIEEDVFAAYAQYSYSGELAGRAFNLLVGLRYEDTDVTSSSTVKIPEIIWEGNNDFNVSVPDGAQSEVVAFEESYDHFLPNLDFDIEVTENVKARFSYSETIARPSYNALASSSTINGQSSPSILSATATASSGNPALVPLESSNIDLSVEYYFDDASYVSLGYYDKSVKNFIGNQQVVENVLGVRDVTAGPRAQAALAELNRLNIPVSDTNLFNMVAATENNIAFNSLTDEEFEQQFDIKANADDPLAQFTNAKPDNSKKANIDGFEFALQHFFGDSGFGFQANYTSVNGDIEFDLAADPSVTQFALVGLSDTANLVALYEKDGLQARIAYNWRDKFLDTATQFENEPGFTESVSQIDFNVSYEVNDDLTVFFEGINITEENQRRHGRSERLLWDVTQLGARYALGARYKF